MRLVGLDPDGYRPHALVGLVFASVLPFLAVLTGGGALTGAWETAVRVCAALSTMFTFCVGATVIGAVLGRGDIFGLADIARSTLATAHAQQCSGNAPSPGHRAKSAYHNADERTPPALRASHEVRKNDPSDNEEDKPEDEQKEILIRFHPVAYPMVPEDRDLAFLFARRKDPEAAP